MLVDRITVPIQRTPTKALADQVYVISLPERTDRRARIRELFDAERIPFEFVDGVRVKWEEMTDPEISEIRWENDKMAAGWEAYCRAAIGCKKAHIHCLERAAEANLRSLLIFEDDVRFVDGDWYSRFQTALAELPDGWLQLYLSAWDFRPATPVTPILNRLAGAFQTTAILYSQDGIEAALNCVRHARAEIDEWMGLHLHQYGCSYIIRPHLTFQDGGHSDCRGTTRGITP